MRSDTITMENEIGELQAEANPPIASLVFSWRLGGRHLAGQLRDVPGGVREIHGRGL